MGEAVWTRIPNSSWKQGKKIDVEVYSRECAKISISASSSPTHSSPLSTYGSPISLH
jgi:hypothetical protein